MKLTREQIVGWKMNNGAMSPNEFRALCDLALLAFAPSAEGHSSRFSDFIRNATPEEKEAVYMDVLKRASARQNTLPQEQPITPSTAARGSAEHKLAEHKLAVLIDAVQYAVNRLDHDPRGPQQPQVSGDLAVALAYATSGNSIPSSKECIDRNEIEHVIAICRRSTIVDAKHGLTRGPTENELQAADMLERILKGMPSATGGKSE